MNRKTLVALAVLPFLTVALGVAGQAPSSPEIKVERQMGVRQKPDTVFSQPVDTFVPELAGASATGENGRVGGELVFWGYKLRDGRPVFLFACAPSVLVNCDERIPLICPVSTNVLKSSMADGAITRRTCRNIAFAAPGDTRPGCTDDLQPAGLAIGLVSCG
jgi:hypothetical protein